MLGMEEFKKSRLYQRIWEEAELSTKLRIVPLFLELGLTVEEVAQRLELTVEQVQQAAQNRSN